MIEVSIIEVSIRRGSTVLYFEFQTQSPSSLSLEGLANDLSKIMGLPKFKFNFTGLLVLLFSRFCFARITCKDLKTMIKGKWL